MGALDLAGPSRSSAELAAGDYHGGRSALFGMGDQPLPHSNLYGDSGAMGLGGMPPPRRQTSRFAFAQAEVDSGYGGSGGYGGDAPFGGGPPPPPAPGGQQPQDAGAFFRSLFPGASVSVGTPPGHPGPSPAPPPGALTSALVGSYGGSGGGSILLSEPRFRGSPLSGGGLGQPTASPMGAPYLQQQQQQPPPPGYYQGGGAGGGGLGGNASGINLLRQLQGSGAPAAGLVHPPGFTRL